MIIIDKTLQKLEQEGKPIRVGMIGAGFMARGILLQILNYVPGMNVVAVSNRNPHKALDIYAQSGIGDATAISTSTQLESNIMDGRYSVTDDPFLLCKSPAIDVILEVTGTIEFSASVILEAIKNKKHVVLMNAEVDGTVGPILKKYADDAGVVITNVDGDQPGVIMNLYRFVDGIGVKPVLCGNIKGLHDPYRNPSTQKEFARKWGQNPHMVTSFADGTKISFEQAIVANATGMTTGTRGMYGPVVEPGTPVTRAAEWYDLDQAAEAGGIVDYVVGAVPSPGVFIIGTHDNPVQQHYLSLYKLGDGPYYCFYTPFHLCHFEVHNTIARAVLFNDATIAPAGPPRVEVVTAAKKDLRAGQVLDGMGGYMTYGLCETYATSINERLLPVGLAEGCTLKRDVSRDRIIGYADIDLPDGRLIDKLRVEQEIYFQDL